MIAGEDFCDGRVAGALEVGCEWFVHSRSVGSCERGVDSCERRDGESTSLLNNPEDFCVLTNI
jgi:hypothetical protein